MRTIIIIIATVMFAGTWTSCRSYGYVSGGVNEYGTRYVVTKVGDTIYRESSSNNNYYPSLVNPYWNANPYFRPVIGPRFIITPKRSKHVPKTSNVNTPRGSRGRGSVPGTRPRPKSPRQN